MTIGLVGKKQGMTRMFTPEGEAFAVSVVSISPNTITQIKSSSNIMKSGILNSKTSNLTFKLMAYIVFGVTP